MSKGAHMPDWSEAYPRVYQSLAPEYQLLPQAQVEQALQGVFGESVGLDTMEGFFDDVGKALGGVGRSIGTVVQQAAPVLAKVAPGLVSGATAGAALGPLGMLAGGLIGGLSGALGPGGRAPAAPGRPASPLGQLTGAASGLLGAGAGPTGAAGQLLAALASPTVQQGLNSMLLGPLGNRAVTTPSGVAAPVSALANMLSMLSQRASAEWESIAPFGETDYLSEAADIDAANPEARAAWLYGQLAPVEIDVSTAESAPTDGSWLDDMYDELEARFYDDEY
jgi:hypothetical protein